MPDSSGAARNVGNSPAHMIGKALAVALLLAAGVLTACSSSPSSRSGGTTAATGSSTGAGITKPVKLAP
jgi:hypothetical protein